MNAADKILDRIRNNKIVAVILVAASILLGVITFFDKTLTFIEKHVASDLKLASMSLSAGASAVFADHDNESCRFDGTAIRTFASSGDRLPTSRLDLVFTFVNEGAAPVAFTTATLEVEFADWVAGGFPGVVESNYTYLLEIDFDTGDQTFPLTPNYNIPASETGAFTLAFTPSELGTGLCWIARVTFDTTVGTVSSPTFQMILTREE